MSESIIQPTATSNETIDFGAARRAQKEAWLASFIKVFRAQTVANEQMIPELISTPAQTVIEEER